MSRKNFEVPFSWIGLKIKVTTKMREPVGVGQRLYVTLRHLVVGNVHVTIAASYRMSPANVGVIMRETYAVISSVLCEKKYLSSPSSEKARKKVSLGFQQR